MGCRSSKSASASAAAVPKTPYKTTAEAPAAAASDFSLGTSTPSPTKQQQERRSSRSNIDTGSSKKSSSSSRRGSPAGTSAALMRLLVKAQEEPLADHANLWSRVIQLCQDDPQVASYTAPKTKSTPLHAACSMVDFLDDGTITTKKNEKESDNEDFAVVKAIRTLIQVRPESLGETNAMGMIPLHYVLAPALPSSSITSASAPPPRWKVRAAVVRLLVSADYDSAMEYLSRNNVPYYTNVESSSSSSQHQQQQQLTTPLYHALDSFQDDFGTPTGDTVDYIAALQEANPPMVAVSNCHDGDKPLALLYRRFTRQFDLSEKFFAGDNSRPEVVEHRRKYKVAAGNTWKLVELLLRPESHLYGRMNDLHQDWHIVHRAVQVDTPPDLLRYIVETNASELTETDRDGNLPLHLAAKSVPPPQQHNNKLDNDNNTGVASFPEFHTKYVVDELLYKFPEGASIPDRNGKFPLALAVDSGKQWIGGGVKSLYDAYPDAMQQIDLSTHPTLQMALSFMDETTEQQQQDNNDNDTDNKNKDGRDVVKDEHHDAIMLVQRPDVDVIEVVTSMWAHEEDAGVQMLGCVAIAKMADKCQDNDAEVLRISLSAVPAVVNAMKAHPNEAIVQEKACTALKRLAGADGKREVSFVASGAIAAVVGAMQAHVADSDVEGEACAAIADIVTAGGDDRATIVASVSGFTAILNALAAHPDVVNVQREGCRALKAVTEYPNANLPELPRSQTEPLLELARDTFPRECSQDATILLSRLS